LDNRSTEHAGLTDKAINKVREADHFLPKSTASMRLPVPLSMLWKPSILSSARYSLGHYWPLVLPLLLLLPGLAAFPYPSSGAIYSDLAITHFPNAVFLKKALFEWHELPFWSSTILSGYPFAANPLSGLWYPPGWLALFFPLPLGFNLLIALHLLWGGIGMLRLLRSEGLGYEAALLGGLAFEAMPKIFAHYGAGHLTLLYAIPWTPWLLLADRRAYQVPHAAKRFLQPGLVLALIFLADVRWTVFAGLLWLAYSLSRRFTRQHLGYLLRQFSLTALISAPLSLPLLEYTRLSTRVSLKPGDVFNYSLPPGRLLGLLFPDLGGFHEWILYPGAAIFMLALLALLWGNVRLRGRFWLCAAVVSILFSLGSGIPGLVYLARLPGIDLLRVPSRALFITGMALAAAAAYTLDHLSKGLKDRERRQANLLLAGLSALVLALSGFVWFASQKITLNFVWGAGMTLATVVWFFLSVNGQARRGLWFAVLMGLVVLDLGLVDHSMFTFRATSVVETEGDRAAHYLAIHPGMYRIYSPSYSMPQQTAVLSGLELADGVDPLQLQSYVSYMQSATGVPWSGYSVTLPPFANGDPQQDNAAYRPDPRLLGLLNVRYVLSDYDLPVEGLVLRERFGSTRIYENLDFRPRAWVQSATDTSAAVIQPAVLNEWGVDRIVVKVDQPPVDSAQMDESRLLVLSELAYPGWQVSVDGKDADLMTFDGILRAVEIGPGSHQVVFTYRPLSVYAGMLLFLIGLSWLFLAPEGFLVRPLKSEVR